MKRTPVALIGFNPLAAGEIPWMLALVSGRVEILERKGRNVAARVRDVRRGGNGHRRDDSDDLVAFLVTRTGQTWSCDCAATKPDCIHVRACKAVIEGDGWGWRET